MALSTNVQFISLVSSATPLARKTRVCSMLGNGTKANNHTNVALAIQAHLRTPGGPYQY
jgi:hypothetical protein